MISTLNRRVWTILLALCVLSGCSKFSVPEFDTPAPMLTAQWKLKLVQHALLQYKPREFSIPTLDPSKRIVVVGTSARQIVAVNAQSGKVLWKTTVRSIVRSQATVTKSIVYVGTAGGRLIALGLKDGKVKWTYDTQGEIVSRPVFSAGRVYFLTNNNHLYAIDVSTKKPAWVYRRSQVKEFGVFGGSTPLIDSGKVYIGFADGIFAAISTVDGTLMWGRKLSPNAKLFKDVDATAVLSGSVLYVTAFDGGVYAMNADNGDILWNTKIKYGSSLALKGDYLYLTTGKKKLYCLLKKTGATVWVTSFVMHPQYNLSEPVVFQEKVFLATAYGLAIVDRLQGAVLEKIYFTKGLSAVPSITGRQMFLLSNGGELYSFLIR